MLWVFFVIFGCKILGLKNPASVKEMTNMRYGAWGSVLMLEKVPGELHGKLILEKVLFDACWQNNTIYAL